MKNAFRFIAVFAMTVLFTISVTAQEKRDPQATAKLVTDNMKNNLSLTEKQYSKVYDANLEFINASQDLRSASERTDKLQQLKMIDESRDQKLKAVLTDAQFERYLAMKKEKRESSTMRGNRRSLKQ